VCSPHDRLPVITLDAGLEAMILQGMVDPVSGLPVIEPDLARGLGERVAALITARGPGAIPPALIVQPRARRTLSAALRFRAPACLVLSISELPQSQPIEVIAVIGGEAAAAPPQLTDQSATARAATKAPDPQSTARPQPQGLAA